jgi:hypothetical protein
MATLHLPELSDLLRAQGDQRASVIKLNLAKKMCIAVLLSAAVCTSAAAQTFRTQLGFEETNGNQLFAQNEQPLAKSAKFTTLFNFDGTNRREPGWLSDTG